MASDWRQVERELVDVLRHHNVAIDGVSGDFVALSFEGDDEILELFSITAVAKELAERLGL